LPFPAAPSEQEGFGIASTVELDRDQVQSLMEAPPPLRPEAPNTTRDEGPLTSWVFTASPPPPAPPPAATPKPVPSPQSDQSIPVAIWILSGIGALTLLVVLGLLVF